MLTIRFYAWPIIMLLVCASAARPGERKAEVRSEPPLTPDMIDDYARLLEWRFGQVLSRAGGTERLRQMIVNDWHNEDGQGRKAMLAALAWWRDEFPRLGKAERERPAPAVAPSALDLERLRQAADARAIHLLMLQRTYDARQQTITGISNVQAKGHDTNMRIIDNIRPSGRYEYNPATGRYDRFVPR